VSRALLALLAIVACGWFVLGARQASDIDRATALLSGTHIDARDAARARSLLSDAALLDPDRQVQILRSEVDYERGAHLQAGRILRGVVAAEPLNLLAWDRVAISATTGKTLALAYRHLSFLMPPIPPPRQSGHSSASTIRSISTSSNVCCQSRLQRTWLPAARRG
jgi:hypothetical protein